MTEDEQNRRREFYQHHPFDPIRDAMPAEQWERVFRTLLPVLNPDNGGDANLFRQLLEANEGAP